MQTINPKKIFLASYVLVNEEKKHPFQLKFDTWEIIDSNIKVPGSPSPEWVNFTFQSVLYKIDFLPNESKVFEYLEYHFKNRLQKLSDQDYLNALELWLWFDSKGSLEGKKYQDKWIREWINKKKEDKPKIKTKSLKPTQIQWALYYYYLQETGDYPHFENHPEGKLKALEELTGKLGISQKHFQQKHNLISQGRERITKENIRNIERVIDMLQDYTNAQKLAKNDLIRARQKR